MNRATDIHTEAERFRFVDPLTAIAPTQEDELTALLCIYHQRGAIDWHNVPLLPATPGAAPETAASIVNEGGHMFAEYPFFFRGKAGRERYGGMRPDILFLSNDRRRAVLIENKLGAPVTHKGDEFGNQFGRYLRYLNDALAKRLDSANLLVLTSRQFLSLPTPWYTDDLRTAVGMPDARSCGE